MAIAKELGVRAASGIDVRNNLVELYVPKEEKEKLEAVLRESGQEPPDWVEIVIQPLLAPA